MKERSKSMRGQLEVLDRLKSLGYRVKLYNNDFLWLIYLRSPSNKKFNGYGRTVREALSLLVKNMQDDAKGENN